MLYAPDHSVSESIEATTAELLIVNKFKQMVEIETAMRLFFLKSELMFY